MMRDVTLLTREQAKAITDRVLGFATADETRVVITSGARMGTRFAVNQITTSGDRFDVVVQVRSAFGKRSATATTNGLDDASLRKVVRTAERLARLRGEQTGVARAEAHDRDRHGRIHVGKNCGLRIADCGLRIRR